MKAILFATVLIGAVGCATMTLTPSDFAWPIESEVTADKAGMVQEERSHMEFNVKPLLAAEQQDTTAVAGKSFRMIRDRKGYYFITAPKFKNVYVFRHADDGLALVNTIMVNEKGLTSPAFNLRTPNIQLLNGREKAILLTKDGVVAPAAPAPKGEGK